MAYLVKELFYSLQGEGARAGRPAVFCRFAGCNLSCDFCDTDHGDGTPYATPEELAAACRDLWPGGGRPYLVATGGEPGLQLNAALIAAFHAVGFEVAVETNGTRVLPAGIDWITVSPKAGTDLRVTAGDEMKLAYPQAGAEPERYEALQFRHFFLQPIDGPERKANTAAAIAWCLAHPLWHLSLQTHKIVGIA
ncbi:MAG: 7-carboxy-7-deazaguanine synthase [Magnetospirillum sp. WYHS-4]